MITSLAQAQFVELDGKGYEDLGERRQSRGRRRGLVGGRGTDVLSSCDCGPRQQLDIDADTLAGLDVQSYNFV